MAKKSGLQSLKLERRELHDKVINYFNQQGDAAYNYKQVSSAVGANTPRRRALIVEILEQLVIDGFLSEVGTGRYKAVNRSSVAEGIFIRRSNGKNSVSIPTDDGNPIMVAERNSMHALNGDRVLVHISAVRAGVEPEAEVIKIIERKQQQFVGTLVIKKYFAHLVTDSKFLATDIFIRSTSWAVARRATRWLSRLWSGPRMPIALSVKWLMCWVWLARTMPKFTPSSPSLDCHINILTR